MIWEHAIANIIRRTFEKDIGFNQYDKLESERQGMLISFSCEEDYSNKYRRYPHFQILLYACGRAVVVCTRKYVTHVTEEELSEKETHVNNVSEEEAQWNFITDHDACWVDALQRVLFENGETFNSLEWLMTNSGTWYSTIHVSEELYKEFMKLRREKYGF